MDRPDGNSDRFEKAAIEHRVILSAYTGADLDLSTPEGAYYGGMETLRAKRESAVRSVRVREAHDRIAREGKIGGGGRRWLGYTRVYANPGAPARKRVVLRYDVNETEAAALRDAAERVLRGETIYSIVSEWEASAMRPPVAEHWACSTLAQVLRSPRLAGLREWQGVKYPAQWPAIFDADTHERLVKLLGGRSRRKAVTGKKRHLLSGVARCGKCGRPLYLDRTRYRCASSPGRPCGGVSLSAELLDEYVTGAVLDRISRARKEYDRLTGSATVFGDIPASDAVRDAWQGWNTDRRHAAIKAVLNQITINPTPAAGTRATRPCDWKRRADGRSSTGGYEPTRPSKPAGRRAESAARRVLALAS